MAKEELLEFEGLVTEILPDARYRVQLDNGHALIAYTAGRMKKNRIKTLAGDRVTVEVSPYDLEKGRMIFRHKDERASTGPRPPQRQHIVGADSNRSQHHGLTGLTSPGAMPPRCCLMSAYCGSSGA